MTLELDWVFPEADAVAGASARAHQQVLTKPPGSLGRLEQLAVQLAGFQAQCFPITRPAALLLFAADHPVTRHGVSPYPSAVTRAMLQNFATGGAAASVLARFHRLPFHVVDVGIDEAPGGQLVEGELESFRREPMANWPAGDLRCEDAMSPDLFAAAVEAGRSAVRRLEPLRVLILGEIGIGNTTVAAAICAALLGGNPDDFVGAGTGASGAMLESKRAVVRDALTRLGRAREPLEVLRRVGGRELAALLGAMGEAISRRTVVVVDGFIVSAAALVLARIAPLAREGMLFAHRSAESGHARLLSEFGAEPLLDLGLRLGEASGALTSFAVIEQACALHNRMATFESAKVPNRI